eukprot:GHVH01004497.1.p1 GENE.GHVH01004497.1~~GHVH01004497.1.p1  ORF type:complete len:679 (+),score=68.16 GHVH01004497.1:758-2794(+)
MANDTEWPEYFPHKPPSPHKDYRGVSRYDFPGGNRQVDLPTMNQQQRHDFRDTHHQSQHDPKMKSTFNAYEGRGQHQAWGGNNNNDRLYGHQPRVFDSPLIPSHEPQSTRAVNDRNHCVNLIGDNSCENVFRFRTMFCEDSQIDMCADKNRCDKSHCLTWQRRNPTEHLYTPRLCLDITFIRKKNGDSKMMLSRKCSNGKTCEHSHSKEEKLYHPLFYKTNDCSNGLCVNDLPGRQYFCPFAHNDNERRCAITEDLRKKALSLLGLGKPRLSGPECTVKPEFRVAIISVTKAMRCDILLYHWMYRASIISPLGTYLSDALSASLGRQDPPSPHLPPLLMSPSLAPSPPPLTPEAANALNTAEDTRSPLSDMVSSSPQLHNYLYTGGMSPQFPTRSRHGSACLSFDMPGRYLFQNHEMFSITNSPMLAPGGGRFFSKMADDKSDSVQLDSNTSGPRNYPNWPMGDIGSGVCSPNFDLDGISLSPAYQMNSIPCYPLDRRIARTVNDEGHHDKLKREDSTKCDQKGGTEMSERYPFDPSVSLFTPSHGAGGAKIGDLNLSTSFQDTSTSPSFGPTPLLFSRRYPNDGASPGIADLTPSSEAFYSGPVYFDPNSTFHGESFNHSGPNLRHAFQNETYISESPILATDDDFSIRSFSQSHNPPLSNGTLPNQPPQTGDSWGR